MVGKETKKKMTYGKRPINSNPLKSPLVWASRCGGIKQQKKTSVCPPISRVRVLQPFGACFSQHGHELTAEMKGHDAICGTHQFAANENRRERRVPADQPEKRFLHFSSLRVFVELVRSVIYAEILEKSLHCMAHAARARAEDHHRPLRAQPFHLIHE